MGSEKLALIKACEQRFWQSVDRSEESSCWEWKLSRQEFGYGHFRVSRKPDLRMNAHRVAFALSSGFIPPVVRHGCDNPGCCNYG